MCAILRRLTDNGWMDFYSVPGSQEDFYFAAAGLRRVPGDARVKILYQILLIAPQNSLTINRLMDLCFAFK